VFARKGRVIECKWSIVSWLARASRAVKQQRRDDEEELEECRIGRTKKKKFGRNVKNDVFFLNHPMFNVERTHRDDERPSISTQPRRRVHNSDGGIPFVRRRAPIRSRSGGQHSSVRECDAMLKSESPGVDVRVHSGSGSIEGSSDQSDNN
jgi:hypothetical protein